MMLSFQFPATAQGFAFGWVDKDIHKSFQCFREEVRGFHKPQQGTWGCRRASELNTASSPNLLSLSLSHAPEAAAPVLEIGAFIPSRKGKKSLFFNRSSMASPIMAPSSSIFGAKMKSGLVSRSSPSISAGRCRKQASHRVLAVMAPTQPQRSPATTGSVKHAMTMTEKILARASERPQLVPGENVWVNVDVLMTHDVCGPGTFGIFKREFGENAKVWDHEKIVIIPDHYIFTSDERANRNVDILRDFVIEQNIKYFYDIKDLGNFKANPDYKGVCHIALAQEGHCRPGEVLLGTDSHTCNAGAFGQFATGIGNTDAGFVLGTGKILLKVPPTIKFILDGEMPNYLLAKDLILQIIGEITVSGATYKSMEFVGSTIESLNMEERMTLCNMVVEAGGKNGVVPFDKTTFNYLEDKTTLTFEPVYSDDHARFIQEYKFDVSKLEPLVAKPHSPDNRALARECKDIKIDRVYIGSCTGGKTEDFLAAAKVFLASGKKVKVPTFLVPATQKVWFDVYSLPVPGSGGKTCSQIFEEAGCDVPASPGCGACMGGPRDIYARMNEPKLRKWNERWVILDPTTGKMEYKIRRNETVVKGTIIFDSNSTITVSPVNFHGLPKYDGCCFYIGTPQKKDYFLCAETPGAARAWVSTLHATQLVLRAHKEAVNSLSGNGSAKFGTVATVVAAANSTAMEASKEIEAAMKVSMRAALGLMSNKTNEGHLDDLTVMKETLRVKDEELQQLAKDLRARDSTIKEIADKLTETAEAAEAAASAAHVMDEGRKLACAQIEHLKRDAEKQLELSTVKLREFQEKVMALSREREMLLKQRDSALQEAQLWRSELAKAREHAVVLEAAVVRAEERARVAEADAETRIKDAAEKAAAAAKEKEDLLALVNILQSQVQRQQSNTKQVLEERSEPCSGADDTLPMTKHVDLSQDDKACLCDSRSVPGNNVVQLAVDGVEICSIGDAEWSDIQSTDARIADVREVAPEAEQSSLDIPVVSPPVDDHQHRGNPSQP